MVVTAESKTSPSIARLRNIGLVAHIDAGKTTTSERILFYTGKTAHIGEVEDGASTMDWMHEEQKRGISITAASTSCVWDDHRINLIDTPGHVDFTVEVERCLRVLDGAIGIFSAVEGVQSQSETVWKQADRYGVPRLAFVNKMDRPGADLGRCVEQIRERLDCIPVLVQLPIGHEESFRGLVDLVTMKALLWTDGDETQRFRTIEMGGKLQADAEAARRTLVEALCEVDDALMVKYLDNGAVSADELRAALRRATLQQRAVPVLCGTARHNKGIEPLLSAIVDYLPSPEELPAVVGQDPHTLQQIERAPSAADAPFAALAFKIQHDPVVGPLTYLRVYSGRLVANSTVFNANKGRREQLGRLVQMHARSYEDIASVEAGDIAAAIGLRSASTGDTLCDERAPIVLESIRIAQPVVSQALEPRSLLDEQKLTAALATLAHEDPTLAIDTDPETGRPLVRGMGELHLEVVLERLRREFHVDVDSAQPKVAYFETVRAPSPVVRYKLERQVGGRGQFAVVELQLRPLPAGSGRRFVVAVPSTEKLSKEYLVAIERGAWSAADRGLVAGYRVTDVELTLLAVQENVVDSSAQAFEIAGFEAFRQAGADALPILLEPIMLLSVSSPDSFLGQVIGDLSSRRGKILGMETQSGYQTLTAEAPLDELFGYATRLRSLSQGKATHTMELVRYAPVPVGIASHEVAGRSKN